jgi:hypothetical protein
MWSDILAAASKTLERFDPPGANTYTAYPWPMSTTVPGETDPSSTRSSYSYNGAVYIATSQRTNRYVIAHEFGHAIVNKVTGSGIPTDDTYWDPTAACLSSPSMHTDGSIEYASKALSEGWADYVSAATWNRTDQDDCWYHSGLVNWDSNPTTLDYFLDVQGTGYASDAEMASWQDCEGDGVGNGLNTGALAHGDFLTNTCGIEATSGLGIEMDWRRMFWDMRTEHGFSNSMLLAVIAEAKADPHCWIETNSIPSDCRPNARMAAAVGSQFGHIHHAIWIMEAGYNGVEP